MVAAPTIGVIDGGGADADWTLDLLQSLGTRIEHCSINYTEPHFGQNPQLHALSTLPQNALLLIVAPAPENIYGEIEAKFANWDRQDLKIIAGSLSSTSIFISGSDNAVSTCTSSLEQSGIPVYHVPGDFASAQKLRLVHDLLLGLHTATAAEAIGLAAKAGLNTDQVYNTIVKAAGNSTAFETRARRILAGDLTPITSLSQTASKLNNVVREGRALKFPLPLASASHQLYTLATSKGYGEHDDSAIIQAYTTTDSNLANEISRMLPVTNEPTPTSSPGEVNTIGIVGLGAMGQGMAASLLRAGFAVNGFDINAAAMEKFTLNGKTASAASSAASAMSNAAVVILMVQNAAQVEDILFGPDKGAESLSEDTVVVLSSTVAPSYVRKLGAKLQSLGRGIALLDAPVSGGVVRAANGTLAIICSGENSSLAKSRSVLLAMTGLATNLHIIQGGIGAASSVKLVNQLLAGVHIAAAAEGMALAARIGLQTRVAFEILKRTDAWSWMLENRTGQMLDADWTPHSALAIFVKDLGIVLDETTRLDFYAPIASAAHTIYLSGAARGWEKEADAGVVRLWELVTGITVSSSAVSPTRSQCITENSDKMELDRLPAAETLQSLPQEYPENVLGSIRHVVETGQVPTLVVLDDDPTGTQTCHDIDVLAVWDAETLEHEFNLNPPGFFILTNSRALPSADARRLIFEICENVLAAAAKTKTPFEIVLRGDSTLRGHLPEEPEAAEDALNLCDGWILTPFFSQGGRITINDVHYVKEGDELIPVSQTPFAQDASFGFKNSDLRQYILEKCGPRFNESSFLSVTIEDIRRGGPDAVAKKLLSVPCNPNLVIIVNAVVDTDMHVFVAGLLQAEKSGRRYLYRTAAGFVSSRLGIASIPPLSLEDIGVDRTATSQPGGLILAGSYVPKTTAQLKALRERRGHKLHVIELPVDQLIGTEAAAEAIVNAAAKEASDTIAAGMDILIMTSRELIKGADALSSLSIGSSIAGALVALMEGISVRPRYIIAKGGITSSDGATKGLKIRRARVLGQAAPGVPLWQCTEETSRHRGVPYVVFPGNVGTDHTLADIVESWAM